MKDLRNFANEEVSTFDSGIHNNNESNFNEESPDSLNSDYKGIVDNFVGRYGQMNENEMMRELVKLVAQKKADGTFDINQIRLAAQKIAPLFNEQQRKKMTKMLEMLE